MIEIIPIPFDEVTRIRKKYEVIIIDPNDERRT